MNSAPQDNLGTWRTPLIVIIAGCLIATLGFGVRSTFGLFLEPVTVARGWDVETFSLAMAIQNLLWGIGTFVAGTLADRFGPSRVIYTGAVAYGIGIWGMTEAETSLMLHLFGGVVTGIGVALTSFSLAMAAMARVVGPEKRSLILGLGTAAGSFGQVVFTPMGQAYIDLFGWSDALLILAGTVMLVLPLAFILPHTTEAKGDSSNTLSMSQALQEALNHRGYVLLTLGFFVCGFHVAFIAIHFPKYINELGFRGACRGYRPGAGRAAQYRRIVPQRHGRAALEQEGQPEHDLFPARDRHYGACDGAKNRIDDLSVRRRDGRFVALNRAADHRIGRAGFWRALFGQPVRHCFHEPSARQFPRHLAGRVLVRSVRHLRSRLVGRGGAGCRGRGPSPADRRTSGGTSRNGLTGAPSTSPPSHRETALFRRR